MTIKTAYSNKEEVNEAINDIKEQLGTIEAKLILFFASSRYDPHEISRLMKESFPTVSLSGCTTSGEIVTGKMLNNSVVAMALDDEIIEDAHVEVVEKIKEEDNVSSALEKFEKHFNQSTDEMQRDKYIGLTMIDGLSGSEEKVMSSLGDKTDLAFVGGSAGDDLKFKSTYVFADGKAYTDAACLTLIKTQNGYEILKTQSFDVTDKKLTATKTNGREVIEFNNKPATKAYAEALEVDEATLSDQFMHNPIGLVIDDEPYVRSPQQINDNKIMFYCELNEGTEFSILEGKNIVEDTQKNLDLARERLGNIRGIINFHCILRTLELVKKNQTEEYGQIFTKEPTVGYSTYGEQLIGHINQTSTMVLFK